MAPVQVADRWFERTRIDPAVTLLWEPHVNPLMRCNIWHLRGRDRDLLVDAGLGLASLTEAARDLFDRPIVAVATHAHLDHVGGMHELADVAVHRAEAEVLADATGDISLDLAAYDPATIAALGALGYDISGGLFTARPSLTFDISTHRRRPTVASRLLDEGDVVDLGDRAFEVLHLPGHSPGSIGLWDAASGTLFAGDAVYDGPLLDEIPGADIEAYVATMRRLRELPVTVVHAGHDPSFGRDRLVELADAYLERRSAPTS